MIQLDKVDWEGFENYAAFEEVNQQTAVDEELTTIEGLFSKRKKGQHLDHRQRLWLAHEYFKNWSSAKEISS